MCSVNARLLASERGMREGHVCPFLVFGPLLYEQAPFKQLHFQKQHSRKKWRGTGPLQPALISQ